MRHLAIIVAVVWTTLFASAAKAEPVKLVLIAGERPAVIEFVVEIDGQPVGEVWDTAFKRLRSFCDVDEDGTLSEVEATRLPSAFGVRQLLWGQVNPKAGGAPPFKDLDTSRDGKVTGSELAAWYYREGAGGVSVGVGTAPGTGKLTEALVKALDTDSDGEVTEKEFRDAAAVLSKLDANDDELVSPSELVEKAHYPGTAGTTRLTPSNAEWLRKSAFPVLLLPTDAADTRWSTEFIHRKDTDMNGSLDPTESGYEADTFSDFDTDADGKLCLDELAPLPTRPADVTWFIRFGGREDDGVSPEAASWDKVRVCLSLRTDKGRAVELVEAARQRFLTSFADVDIDRDGHITLEEAGKVKPSPLEAVIFTADRDGDDRLSESEPGAWLDIQSSFAAAHVLVTVLDHGAGLFELLDADHDGMLSNRELRTGWERIKAADAVTEGEFDQAKLPHQLLVIVSRGQPTSPLGRTPRLGPTWFNAMDRNGDGEVSRREFNGRAAVFERMDSDKDGFLDPEEGAKSDMRR